MRILLRRTITDLGVVKKSCFVFFQDETCRNQTLISYYIYIYIHIDVIVFSRIYIYICIYSDILDLYLYILDSDIFSDLYIYSYVYTVICI